MSCTTRTNLIQEEPPVQAGPLQDAYRNEVERRFEAVGNVIEITVAENDALRIEGGAEMRFNDADDIAPRDDFEFTQNPAKEAAFRNQLQEWIDQGILEPVNDEQVGEGQHWTGAYALAGYKAGVEFADGLLRQRGREIPDTEAAAVVTRPIHVSTLREVYLRNYRNLEGITTDMDRAISATLAESLRDGHGTSTTASRLVQEVENMQHTRARSFARTEMMNAHHQSAFTRYESFGIGEVEILTHDPCLVCQRIEANDPYPIEEGRTLIPAHPNCECVPAPVI